ncbi:MAG TPA: hypothetical protein VD816_14795 [Ohtaekwangia sp.]|nr:hypothetical protein [Ohtaekwangia sp.]
MKDSVNDRISIYLSVDNQTIAGYFNAHDPSPLYNRQISHQLEQYIVNSVANAKRYSAVFYKLKCSNEMDKQYAEPLMYAIRAHYEAKKNRRKKEFSRFKWRSWILLAFSLVGVAVCQVVVPIFLNPDNNFHTALGSSLDIFSWVLLWRPIDVLLFSWNPHLKDICLLNKLAKAEVIVIEYEK